MLKILVIEDEKSISNLLKHISDLDNSQVLYVSITEALNIFRQYDEAFDVVITDLKILKLIGFDVFLEAKRQMPQMNVIIFIDNFVLQNDTILTLENSVEYILKPVSVQALQIAIINTINKRNLLMENIRLEKELFEHKNYLHRLQDSAEKILMNMLPKNSLTFQALISQ